METVDLKWDHDYSQISPQCPEQISRPIISPQGGQFRMDAEKNVFQNLCFKLGTPETDLFTSRVSHQLSSIATDVQPVP